MSKDEFETHIIRSSQAVIRDFFDSVIWRDIKGLREDAIKELQVNLEDIKIGIEYTMFIRGKIAGLREFVNLEDELLESKKLQDEVEAALEAEEEN